MTNDERETLALRAMEAVTAYDLGDVDFGTTNEKVRQVIQDAYDRGVAQGRRAMFDTFQTALAAQADGSPGGVWPEAPIKVGGTD